MPVITSRAMSGCHDSFVDWVKVNYKENAISLLDKCITDDLKSLLL